MALQAAYNCHWGPLCSNGVTGDIPVGRSSVAQCRVCCEDPGLNVRAQKGRASHGCLCAPTGPQASPVISVVTFGESHTRRPLSHSPRHWGAQAFSPSRRQGSRKVREGQVKSRSFVNGRLSVISPPSDTARRGDVCSRSISSWRTKSRRTSSLRP